MRQSPPGAPSLFHEIDHTADRGIVVQAATPAALFEKAGLALSAIIVDPEGVGLAESRIVAVTGAGWGDVLQRWLAEILVLFSGEGFVAGEIVVEVAQPGQVRGILRGDTFDARRHEVHGEVKAVTYHELTVTRTPAGWCARVILDV
jgi:SHS2 domain-containing protein